MKIHKALKAMNETSFQQQECLQLFCECCRFFKQSDPLQDISQERDGNELKCSGEHLMKMFVLEPLERN